MPAGTMIAAVPHGIKRWFFNNMAAWCVLFRRRDRALDFYRKMLALDPNDVLALASIGYQSAQLGRKREALAMFDRVLELEPDDAEAHFNRGFLLQERNDHEGAMAAFQLALAINPDHDRALYGIALSLISTRRPEEALAPLKRNTELQPMSPYGWYQLARVQHDLGRSDETQKVLDHLAKFEPNVARQLERETGLKAKPLS
ncbi:MAG TPA: tetratricopeptide repeat protein [Methylomirabilota bacterium]|nr:tetratricopeptide repeat protein [Methylomirabilota bacterium]